MLRDILIDRDLFEKIQEKILDEEIDNEDIKLKKEMLEKAVFKKLRKKRSIKKYKRNGIKKEDLKEIIEFAGMVSLEIFGGPSDFEIEEEHPQWCSHCGTCCMESSPIFIHRDELSLLLRFNPNLKHEIISNDQYPEHFRFKEDIPCKFHNIEAKRCKIYDSRPHVCRSYPLVLMGNDDRPYYVLDLYHKCDYAINLILEKSIILFDEAVNHI
ncbi:YkgJ family cysteine cluster protein [Methanobacterium sp.]|uniref:YkgJ family cysteine cluster protein n=1 Tax=Methanobacterium sp. TaxID=2164 RepID=UPI003C743B3E